MPIKVCQWPGSPGMGRDRWSIQEQIERHVAAVSPDLARILSDRGVKSVGLGPMLQLDASIIDEFRRLLIAKMLDIPGEISLQNAECLWADRNVNDELLSASSLVEFLAPESLAISDQENRIVESTPEVCLVSLQSLQDEIGLFLPALKREQPVISGPCNSQAQLMMVCGFAQWLLGAAKWCIDECNILWLHRVIEPWDGTSLISDWSATDQGFTHIRSGSFGGDEVVVVFANRMSYVISSEIVQALYSTTAKGNPELKSVAPTSSGDGLLLVFGDGCEVEWPWDQILSVCEPLYERFRGVADDSSDVLGRLIRAGAVERRPP